jgi:carbonic anhydrase
MTDDEIFADVLRANDRYAQEFELAGIEARARRGLAIVTCIDSRIEPLALLGLEPGDAKIIRNAGGRVTDDVVADLVLAAHLLGVDRVMVMPHTDCRMAVPDAATLHRAVRDAGGPDTETFDFRVAPDQQAALRADVERVHADPALAHVRTGGFVYDVASGRLSRIC